MKRKLVRTPSTSRPTSRAAFTIVELAAVVATIFVLAGLLLPAVAKTRSHTNAAIDLSNVHQILRAVHTYATENTDYCPAPGWGTTTKCWVYSAGIPSGALGSSSSLAAADKVVSNQVAYFLKSQLAPYLGGNQKVLDCPTDVDMRRSGNYKSFYMQRSIKLTSYGFSGAVSGFGATKQAVNANNGGTYKLSDFLPSSFLLWEPDETRAYNFNDAGINQEDAVEGVSQRHANLLNVRAIANSALRGTFGGSASYINPKIFNQLRAAPAENDLRCGPGYR
jgi:type II secretory pathway pseudopilin PulG